MLKLENINKKIGEFSLRNISFNVHRGEYFVLIGETGAGKSLLLEIITGILNPDSGTIELNGQDMTSTPTQKRNIGIVYQKPSLFPHMSVYNNIAYPLKIRRKKPKDIRIRVNQLSKELDIDHLLHRDITNLSGGETQRVTIARTLATDPDILLLDEPLSYLDVQLKREMSALLRRINQNGKTIIHVTHDYEEAISLTNKIGILENGIIIQTGSAREVFSNPKSAFIASFVGIRNFCQGTLRPHEAGDDLKVFESSGILFTISTKEPENTEGFIIIPSESITLSGEKLISSAINNFPGIILDIFQTKTGTEVIVDIGIPISAIVTPLSIQQLNLYLGKKVWISFKTSSIAFVRSHSMQ